jgi:HTH-type transcriptional regulator/antitoxin HipB
MDNYARTPKQIGEILQRIRRSSDLTQAELGEKSGLWQETISKVERGVGGTLITFCDILAALDLELMIIPRRKSSSKEIEDIF